MPPLPNACLASHACVQLVQGFIEARPEVGIINVEDPYLFDAPLGDRSFNCDTMSLPVLVIDQQGTDLKPGRGAAPLP